MAAVRSPSLVMRAFALQQTRTLLRRLAYQVNRASRPGHGEVVEDLRASTAIFTRCLRLFAQFLPEGKSKRVRRELKELADLATAVHRCEKAAELLRMADVPVGSPLVLALARDRKEAITRLRTGARRLGRRNFSQKWRAGLRL